MGVCWAPNRRGFVSRRGLFVLIFLFFIFSFSFICLFDLIRYVLNWNFSFSQFRAEQYGDIVELRKLCSLIGPYGVKLIDRELLLRIKSFVVSIKVLHFNSNDLLYFVFFSKHNSINSIILFVFVCFCLFLSIGQTESIACGLERHPTKSSSRTKMCTNFQIAQRWQKYTSHFVGFSLCCISNCVSWRS